MATFSAQQIADIKASIAKRYDLAEYDNGIWCVIATKDGYAVNDNEHDWRLDAEAEMKAIIQDEVKAAMEEME